MTLWRGLADNRRSRAGLEDDKSRMGQGEDIQAAQATADLAQATADLALAQPPIGSINMWGGTTDPADGTWLICDGRTLAKVDYPELFSIYSSTWNTGGEGVDEFRIPDFRSRSPVGAGQGAGLSNRSLSSTFGVENHTLLTSEMPVHNHTATLTNPVHKHGFINGLLSTSGMSLSSAAAGSSFVTWNVSTTVTNIETANNSQASTASISNTGSGSPHYNMPPGLAVNFILRVL